MRPRRLDVFIETARESTRSPRRRDDLLDDYANAVRAIEAAKSAERQREALEDACRRGTELSHEHWGLLKDMSLVKRSLAGVDEFEDSDTKNRFYRWRDIKAEAERLDNEEDQEITRGAASLRRRLRETAPLRRRGASRR